LAPCPETRRTARLLAELLATEAILAEEERRNGGLPPRFAAMLGRPAAPS
jgi:hypothetical protein